MDTPLDLFVEHLMHIDCGVLDPEAGLAGRTWLVDVVLTGRRNAQGMLFDFGHVKRDLKAAIDALIDHRLLIPRQAPGLTAQPAGYRLITTTGARIDYAGPDEGMAVIDAEHIGPVVLGTWLTERVRPLLPNNIDGLSLTLREEPIADAWFHYCHGLRSHDGNCQRIGHGHRGRLAITVDGADRPDLARQVAETLQGVFIGHRDDLVATDHDGRHHFAYHAAQGDFSLALDAARCITLDGPPTIENIAAYLAERLKQADPAHGIAVRAYEGTGKGAVARRD